MNDRQSIESFLAEPVPGGSEMIGWRQRCIALGKDAPEAFLAALAYGNMNAQYAAILGLRLHGWEAEARTVQDMEADDFFVRKPGDQEWIRIRPTITLMEDPGLTITASKPV